MLFGIGIKDLREISWWYLISEINMEEVVRGKEKGNKRYRLEDSGF